MCSSSNIEYPNEAGQFCWHDVVTDDIHATAKFLTGLLGWEAVSKDGATHLMDRGAMIGCLSELSSEWRDAGIPPSIMSYIQCHDIDASTNLAKNHGARVLVSPMAVGDMGRMSVVRDPTGGIISLWQPTPRASPSSSSLSSSSSSLSSTTDNKDADKKKALEAKKAAKVTAADGVNDDGGDAKGELEVRADVQKRSYDSIFRWHQLYTTDVKAANEFYVPGLNWRERGSGEYKCWGPRVSIKDNNHSTVAAIEENGRSQWMTLIDHADPDGAVVQVKELGGKIIRAPFDFPSVARAVWVADPRGVQFILFKPIPPPSSAPPTSGDDAELKKNEATKATKTEDVKKKSVARNGAAKSQSTKSIAAKANESDPRGSSVSGSSGDEHKEEDEDRDDGDGGDDDNDDASGGGDTAAKSGPKRKATSGDVNAATKSKRRQRALNADDNHS